MSFKETTFRASHLELWNSKLSRDTTVPLVDKVVEAVMYDQDIPVEHTDEYRNIYSYDKLWEGLSQFDQSEKQLTASELVAGLSYSFKLFSKPSEVDKLSTASLLEESGQLFKDLGLKENKAAGLTAYGESKIEAFTVALDKACKILDSGKVPSPCLAGVRTQRKGKTRLVWGYPLEMTILEALIARPIIDWFKSTPHVMTFGAYSHEIGTRFRRCASEYRYHYSIDYSHFDASVNRLFIHHAFNAFRTWYDLSQKVYGDVTVGDVFDIVENYFIFTPIVMPKAGNQYPVKVSGKKNGVPSGSYFTQIVDSFTNVSLIMSASKRFDLGLNEHNVFVLGDDCLFFSNATVSLQKLSGFVSTFGFKVNPSKGSFGAATNDIEYLGRRWRNGFPIRTLQEIERGALYPEKFRRYSSEAGIRKEQALQVLNSYLLTSYLDVANSQVGTKEMRSIGMLSEWMTNGFTHYLLDEGLLPGKTLNQAIY